MRTLVMVDKSSNEIPYMIYFAKQIFFINFAT